MTFFQNLPVVSFLIKWMGSNDMDPGPFLFGTALFLILGGLFALGVTGGGVFSLLLLLTPIWLPIILFFVFYNKWMDMVGMKFYLSQGRTTLRIKLPPEVTKSPEAMEFVISQIHNTANPDNLMQTYLDGKRPLPFSFEIVSIGGEVRFYVNVPTKKTKNAFESNLYAQYPGVEIVEEPIDYAAEVPTDFAKQGWTVFAVHMGKKKDQELPIKTYIDYGLDKLPKEEEKVDPMTPMLEVMASIAPHERLFVQIIATSFRPDSFKNGQLIAGEGPKWTDGVTKMINEMMNRDPKTKAAAEGGTSEELARLTAGERSTIEAMERNAEKYAYKTGIRWLYINTKGQFNGDLINPVIRSFSQYDLVNRNAIGVRWRTDFNYKDLFPGGKKKALDALKKAELKMYRNRTFYPRSAGDAPKIFTSEELATMFHLPGRVAITPTLDRVPSTRSEAPANLPTGDL
jgi:hypothetical protein